MSEYTTENLALILEEIKVGVMIIGRDDGIIHFANKRAAEDLHLDYNDVINHNYRRVFWPEFISVYNNILSDCEDGKEHTVIYYWSELAVWEQATAHNIQWGSIPSLLISSTNVSEVLRSDYRFENLLYFDNLLKMPNGEKMEKDLNAMTNREGVFLIYFELNGFKDVNDLYGWDIGDQLLIQIRDWMLSSETLRAQFYRIGNGFAILGRNVSLDDAKKRSEMIMDRFRQPWQIPLAGEEISVYCPIRLCIVDAKYVQDEIRSLLMRTIQETDNSMYSIYSEEIDQKIKRSVVLRDSLVRSIFDNMRGFEVYYQPIVEVPSRRWIGLEALCRWTTPDGQRVPPLQFIHMAEQLGLVHQVDAWVRKTAMEQCVSLGLDKMDFLLDVNLSPMQVIEGDFIDNLLYTIKDTGFPMGKLNIEITESSKMNLSEENINRLKQLSECGIRLSLDDFGTGYSSLEYLMRLLTHAIKTEKLFLDKIEKDENQQHLLKTLIDLAHHRGMKIITEGVETEEQYDLLQAYGVDHMQGYLFSRPMPFDRLKEVKNQFGTGVK